MLRLQPQLPYVTAPHANHPCYRLYNVLVLGKGPDSPSVCSYHPALTTMAPEQKKQIMPFGEEELSVRMNTTFMGHTSQRPEQWVHIPQSLNLEVQTQGQPVAG